MAAKYPPVQFRLPTLLYEQLDRLSGKVSVSEKAKAVVLDYLLAQSRPHVVMTENTTSSSVGTVKVDTTVKVPEKTAKPRKKLMRRRPLEIADELAEKREARDTGVTGGWKGGTGLLGEPDIDMMTGQPRLPDAAPWFENGEWYWVEGGEKFRSAEKPDV